MLLKNNSTCISPKPMSITLMKFKEMMSKKHILVEIIFCMVLTESRPRNRLRPKLLSTGAFLLVFLELNSHCWNLETFSPDKFFTVFYCFFYMKGLLVLTIYYTVAAPYISCCYCCPNSSQNNVYKFL